MPETKFYMPLNLQFFSDDNEQDDLKKNNKDESDETKKTESIPYSRFKEVNDNYKSVKQKYDELIQKQQTAEEEAKKKQGEFQSLYETLKSEHDPLKEKYGQYESTFKSILATKLESVPEEYKELIPKGSELEQLQWIEQAQAKNLFGKQKQQDFGNKGNNPNNDKKAENLREALALKFKK
ncbi:hypothetical protein [Bacillus sp. SM2101]|uniref:hypothetical protein n=1 Tax=Bacillus sp. SM2101 TaxID=2805366 RepID=UPI001BDF231E|nr:hypothetical protein [Bacillus sp. SM2101]